MRRRDVVKAAAALPAAGLVQAAGTLAAPGVARGATAPRPNILFILVDELRYPSVFPAGINSVPEFLARFMPNVYRLWQRGVKFANHYTAANACTPARGVLYSGLYSQQSFLIETITAAPFTNVSVAPVLNRAFPTYGKLLKKAGYQTPFVGKWHVSIPGPEADRLAAYGFEGLTYYDPTGANLQGTVGDAANGYLNDRDIANQAADWLRVRSRSTQPWCLTVSFVNPHDHEFFWAGTEFDRYNSLFDGTAYEPFTYFSFHNGQFYPPVVRPGQNPLKSPPAYGYPELPPNWESAAELQRKGKPSTQLFARTFQGAVWGEVSDDRNQRRFTLAPYPNPANEPALQGLGIGVAPFNYWQRSLDSYTQTMTIVDRNIGIVLDALPRALADDTVIVFCADHGDYAGAHGYARGKIGTAYDEAYHVPLIVADGTGRFAGQTDRVRQSLTSSVDITNLLVSLGYNGSQSWITPSLRQPYATRHNMIPMLRSAAAPGRDYVLLVTDEAPPDVYLYNDAPTHVIGVRTEAGKLGVYANWIKGTTQIDPNSLETEYYDYGTARGRLELDTTPNSPAAKALQRKLFNDILPNELRAPIAADLRAAQRRSERAYVRYAAERNGQSRDELAYGRDF